MKQIPAAVLATLAVFAAVLAGTTSASAAATDPRVHVAADAVTQENGFAAFSAEYRCPAGTTATLEARLTQGGTPGDPDSLFVRGPERSPVLTCDGATRTVSLGVLLVDYDEDGAGLGQYAFLCDTQICDLKAEATVTIVTGTGASDSDDRRLKVVSR
jgi:hypothetical protein